MSHVLRCTWNDDRRRALDCFPCSRPRRAPAERRPICAEGQRKMVPRDRRRLRAPVAHRVAATSARAVRRGAITIAARFPRSVGGSYGRGAFRHHEQRREKTAARSFHLPHLRQGALRSFALCSLLVIRRLRFIGVSRVTLHVKQRVVFHSERRARTRRGRTRATAGPRALPSVAARGSTFCTCSHPATRRACERSSPCSAPARCM